ncbi:uncharacterized protein N7482_006135 [Penicillium canariense]|uniref:Uncharacterized protein n=1 Tax=Penicillium canariense TaxID=189055 RepID=A0A9W9I3N4_9EURO|nr:uncharacterized protein N7482_006135 [Penicillium canariense]KAJ5167354.1 hypothetical protein N7482_006135 [Penicillium canariense]
MSARRRESVLARQHEGQEGGLREVTWRRNALPRRKSTRRRENILRDVNEMGNETRWVARERRD